MAQFVEGKKIDLNDRFFVNFCKYTSKQQKSLVYLYMDQFDGKITFLTQMTIFWSITVKMFKYNKQASFSCILLILMRKILVLAQLVYFCKNASI